MTIWISVVIAGIINYLTRLGSVLLIKPERLSESAKKILGYVPSAVFPAIIFPAVFFNDNGYFVDVNDPKIFGILAAIIIGFFSRNIIATIISGLVVYWIFIL